MREEEQTLEQALETWQVAYDAWIAHPDDEVCERAYLAAHNALVQARIRAVRESKENDGTATVNH